MSKDIRPKRLTEGHNRKFEQRDLRFRRDFTINLYHQTFYVQKNRNKKVGHNTYIILWTDTQRNTTIPR